VQAYRQRLEEKKRVYGIGQDSKKPPPGFVKVSP